MNNSNLVFAVWRVLAIRGRIVEKNIVTRADYEKIKDLNIGDVRELNNFGRALFCGFFDADTKVLNIDDAVTHALYVRAAKGLRA